MNEDVVLLGPTRSLVGIVTEPPAANRNRDWPAVILLNAGLIHRVGPSRVYVKIARNLADLGFTVLRFDLSNIGDSKAREDHLPYEKSAIAETQDAMTYLSRARGCRRFVLMGHCSGAINSFRTAAHDPRVAGVVLINAEGGSDEWSTYDHRRKMALYYQNYYGKGALLDRQRWKRLLSGRADYRSIVRNVFRSIIWNRLSNTVFRLKNAIRKQRVSRSSPEIEAARQALRAMIARNVRILFVYSEGSSGLEHTRLTLGDILQEHRASDKLKLDIVPRSDHIFTLIRSQELLTEIIRNWMQETV